MATGKKKTVTSKKKVAPEKKKIVRKKKSAISKYTIGKQRAIKAREELQLILTDEDNPLFLSKDTDLAKRYGVSRLTVRNIRANVLDIPSRADRIVTKLKHMETKNFTINELSEILNVKYQNLYKIIIEAKIPVKNDTPPIENMLKYQREKYENRKS